MVVIATATAAEEEEGITMAATVATTVATEKANATEVAGLMVLAIGKVLAMALTTAPTMVAVKGKGDLATTTTTTTTTAKDAKRGATAAKAID